MCMGDVQDIQTTKAFILFWFQTVRSIVNFIENQKLKYYLLGCFGITYGHAVVYTEKYRDVQS